jgi:peptidoglycan/LPS O-acetylase OafA/YrhL
VPVNFAMRAALRRFGVHGPLHMPYATLVTLIQISLACAVAWLSYTFLESRFLLLKRNFEPQAEPCYR